MGAGVRGWGNCAVLQLPRHVILGYTGKSQYNPVHSAAVGCVQIHVQRATNGTQSCRVMAMGQAVGLGAGGMATAWFYGYLVTVFRGSPEGPGKTR